MIAAGSAQNQDQAPTFFQNGYGLVRPGPPHIQAFDDNMADLYTRIESKFKDSIKFCTDDIIMISAIDHQSASIKTVAEHIEKEYLDKGRDLSRLAVVFVSVDLSS